MLEAPPRLRCARALRARLLISCVAFVACGKAELDEASPQVVRGRVVDLLGAPLSDVQISTGQDIVTTGADGAFEVEAFGSSYDLVLATTDPPRAALYHGLTAEEPRLEVHTFGPDTHQAWIKWHDPLPKTDEVGTAFIVDVGDAAQHSKVEERLDTDAAPMGLVRWVGDLEAHVHAFRYERDPLTKEPIRYLGYAEVRHSLRPDEVFEWDVVWQEPTFEEHTIEVAAKLHDGTQLGAVHLWPHFEAGKSNAFPITVELPRGETVASLAVPVIDGVLFNVMVEMNRKSTWQFRSAFDVAASTSTVELDERDAFIELLAPAEASDVGIGSTLSFRNPSGLPVVVRLSPEGPSTEPSLELEIVTEGESVTLPSLARFGLRYPHASTYRWFVSADGAESVDELAAGRPSLHHELQASSAARAATIR